MVSPNGTRETPMGSSHTSAPEASSSAASAPRTLPAPALAFVSGVILVAVAVSAAALGFAKSLDPVSILVWAAAAGVSHWLIFRTPEGRGEISLGTTVHLAMAVLVPPQVFIPALWLSRAVNQAIQRRAWYRALFNAAQITLSVLTAHAVYQALGGSNTLELSAQGLLRIVPAFLAAAATYYVSNVAAVSVAIALSSAQSPWAVWQKNYGYSTELVGNLGLVLLVPIVVLSHVHFGVAGLVAFLLPMVFMREAGMRYVELRRTQQHLIGAERLAAKGEIASAVGHEINNFLTVSVCELQLLLRHSGALRPEELRKRVGNALLQLDQIGVVSRGLLDFSRKESQIRLTRINELIENTLSFLKFQPRFESLKIEMDLDPRVDEVSVEPSQMQQVLMGLLANAADAMEEAQTQNRVLSVWLRRDDRARVLEFGIADSGPGIPEELRNRIFEPGFTTRLQGSGFGLSTAHTIVVNHKGSIRVEDGPRGGAQFRVTLPYHAIGVPSRPAAQVGPMLVEVQKAAA